MRYLIFKTDVSSFDMLEKMHGAFMEDPGILNWTIDLEDIDKVLRIESNGSLNESHIIRMVNGLGFYCEELE